MKQKRPRLNVSDSDEDIPRRKQRSHIAFSDNDFESYDISSEHSRDPACRRLY